MSHVLLVLLIFWINRLWVTTADDITELGEAKLNELLSRSSKNPLIEISGSDFNRFIASGPRPYYALIILTALKSGSCTPCSDLHPSIESLAQMIESQRSKMANDELPVFVMNVDFIDNRNTFSKLGLNTAPMVILVPFSKTRKEIPLGRFFKSIPNKFEYSLISGRSAEDIGNWLKKTLNSSLSFTKKLELPPIHFIILIILAIVIVLYAAQNIINYLRRSMFLYAFVSMLAYGFIIGGGMFPRKQNSPWYHRDGKKIAYLSHQSRYQFGIETYIIGAANLLAGFGVFLYINVQRSQQRTKFKNLILKYIRYIPTAIPFIAMIIGWYIVLYCYNFKNHHYNYGNVGMKG